ncbi:T9SS type B sorting domain-containing protein [Cyclobacterium qasimii]|uniref:TonB-dependent receptor n=2 Tax=Cyclobacterium qasimii TaxID=1350429 RepID=S7VEH0_9BACT|nr:gliding motility-associated C-terminal domain-containing protein [Cyclobacterium qasimii]EPR68426.1 TonB-dependent receptor [Cyclobacterium qasimii M12-11B]GEO23756.1 hypothetical protein CQA01_42900 [Cyclobacterium qasimii]
MKSNHFKSIFEFIIKVIFLFWCLGTPITIYAQGFNNNEWIFGYCEGGDNNYLSFGKDGKANVESLSGNITLGKANTAMAIDPISGEILFYTDGALVYNYLNDAMQGVVGELGGVETAQQSVAISAFDYDLDEGGAKDFYIFYISEDGQLQYSLVDMNDQGGAPSDQPPAGAVTQGGTIGDAQGAILAVKSGSSLDYIVSYDNGNLTAKKLEDQQGLFTDTDILPLASAPQTMLFDEGAGVLYIVSDNPDEDILVVPFDADTGLFGEPTTIPDTAGPELITGLAVSPEGDFLYYAQGDELYRFFISEEEIAPEIPASQIPSATAVKLPLTSEIYKVYDVKVGPDDQLYYIYEEVEGGPQFVGRVTMPDEWSMGSLAIEELPFDGSDFCGTVFPQFSPNIDLGPTVDFTWDPEMPCMNTSIQLTSEVTPQNYRPVSFEWEILPPLVDEEGEEIEMDLSVEHLLLPAEATAEEQVTVSLTVTYANGETGNVTKSISLTENNLTAQFSPSDTTLCEPACIDLMPLLEAQSESEDEGQGGQQGGGNIGGGTGSGGETNYEYFWSNKRDEGWGPEAPNEVCEPGYYWVLVREQGSSCYAYAGIRIKIWDIEDQSNNIWYFGDGAGLDFNRDPDDPNAPTPRPIETAHPQDIPAGVTTVSDQTGQVLFYTDGQTVWDLNGDPMQNGEDIGGDNLSSSSVMAVPIATDETLYYLFTTQLGAGGQNEVRYSLVDIKGDNPDGIGNVVTKDNLLFSPSTQHSAAFNSGDTIWVAFHEKGNNTYRLYPVNDDGIAQPVFNSVGSNFDFGDGSGTMKFSSDGDKVAVTFKEGGSNKLEIFDFDQETGEMEPYALLDLGTEGDIYGLEFSDDSNRVFVSYTNGGPGIEEYFIQGFEETDNSDPENPVTTVCPDCFEDAKFQAQIESCILSSKAVISGTESLALGALQIGPDGQIYSAVVGSNQIGQVQVGGTCNPSTFTQQGVAAMPGTTNLGLPSFVQNSGSSIPDPSLDGPDRLCLGNDIGARGVFEGGGEPDIDIYNWTIFDSEGEVVDEFLNGGEDLQELEYFFQEVGMYTVQLQVDRCGSPWEEVFTHEVEVVATPVITLPSEISLCGEEITLVAVDPEDPRLGEYYFRWVNAAGVVVGSSNELTVTEESIYTVLVAYIIPEEFESEDEDDVYQTCPVSQSVFVGPPFEFTIEQSAEAVCYGDTVSLSPDTPVSGTWSIRNGSDGEYSLIGESQELELNTGDLDGPGSYELLFQTADPLNSNCLVERTATLEVTGLPEFSVTDVIPSQSCTITNGSIVVEVSTQLDRLVLEGTDEVFVDIQENSQITIDNLAPGTYTFTGYIGSCETTHSAVVENSTPPDDVSFTVSTLPESCSDAGSQEGAIVIVFDGDPASGEYTITNVATGEIANASFIDRTSINIALPEGSYVVEVANELGCVVPAPGTYEIPSGEEEIVLTSAGFCGGVVTTEIIAEADLSLVDRIEWYYVVGASKNLLVGEETANLIVSSPGTYEIQLFNAVGCLLGTEQITLNQIDAVPPVLSPNYDICLASNDLVTLDVGNWDSYEWSLGGALVSTDPSFTPVDEGNYTLMVIDAEGCDYTLNFTVTEVCEVNVVYPNAIRPDDPDRNFLIYTTGEIDALSVLIYNRWGELIYFCEQENISGNISVCGWDGMVNGRKVPSGTYPIVVKFTNEEQNINKIKRDAIVVIE